MGAWGEGPFDNDDASDWVYGFEGLDAAGGLQMLADALDVGGAGEYLEAPEGVLAVASAAVVAWMRDLAAVPESPYGEVAVTWIRTARATPTAELLAAALTALDRVRSDDSELAELWAESDAAAWFVSLGEIEARLRG